MKIVVDHLLGGAAEWADVVAAHPDDTFFFAESADAVMGEIGDAEVLIAASGGVFAERVRAAPKLKWVQVLSAGVDRLRQVPELIDRDIIVTNARGVLTPNVAETGIALLTGLTRGVQLAARHGADGGYSADYPYDELDGKRALVVGAGSIGRALAKRLHGLEAQVRGIDLFPQPPDEFMPEVLHVSELSSVLPETDVLAIACPLTDGTRRLIDADALAALPNSAYLINVSRGAVVDSMALVDALRGGQLRGAGLDTFDPEPVPPDHPIWEFDNVIVTPHVGGVSPLREPRMVALAGRNLRRYQSGEPLENVIDKLAGF